MITDDTVTRIASFSNINASRAEIRHILERFESFNTSSPVSEGLRPDEHYVLNDIDYGQDDTFTSKDALYAFLSRKAADRNWDEVDVENNIEVYIRRKEDCTLEVTKAELTFKII